MAGITGAHWSDSKELTSIPVKEIPTDKSSSLINLTAMIETDLGKSSDPSLTCHP